MKLLVISFLAMASAEFDIEPYIHGGKEARNGQIPHQVGLSITEKIGRFRCGGSLISHTFILTAAHCVHKALAVTTYMGKVKFAEGTSRPARLIIIHSGWTGDISDGNDIALLRIPFVKFTKFIRKIKLPAISKSYPDYLGHVAMASGWGLFSDSSPTPQILQYARYRVISNAECVKAYGDPTFTIPKSSFCAANPIQGAQCRGDSGGPLVDKKSKTLIGISSFSPRRAGCTHHLGSAFTRVTYYRRWIKDITRI